jgi:hypothetical protein
MFFIWARNSRHLERMELPWQRKLALVRNRSGVDLFPLRLAREISPIYPFVLLPPDS